MKCPLYKPDLKTQKIHISHELNIRPLVFIAFENKRRYKYIREKRLMRLLLLMNDKHEFICEI